MLYTADEPSQSNFIECHLEDSKVNCSFGAGGLILKFITPNATYSDGKWHTVCTTDTCQVKTHFRFINTILVKTSGALSIVFHSRKMQFKLIPLLSGGETLVRPCLWVCLAGQLQTSNKDTWKRGGASKPFGQDCSKLIYCISCRKCPRMVNIRESGCRLGVHLRPHLRDQGLDVMKKRKTRPRWAHIAVWTTSLKRVELIVADLLSRGKEVGLDTIL